MKNVIFILPLLALNAGALATRGAGQQAPSPQPAAGGPVTIEYYYKLVPGAATPGGGGEWLALYKKNHNPILQQLIKEGLLKSEKLYERRFHAASPDWNFKVVMVWRDWAALQEANTREPEIIHSLYPDKAAHDREEKRRWELTERHWDDVLREVPLE
jgi:hypothetical protein